MSAATQARPATRNGTGTGRSKTKLGSATVKLPSAARTRAIRTAATLFKQMGDATRLEILLVLAEGERHVGAICDGLDQSQPAVSHHLALLRHGGLIEPRRQGKNNFYALTDRGAALVMAVRAVIGGT